MGGICPLKKGVGWAGLWAWPLRVRVSGGGDGGGEGIVLLARALCCWQCRKAGQEGCLMAVPWSVARVLLTHFHMQAQATQALLRQEAHVSFSYHPTHSLISHRGWRRGEGSIFDISTLFFLHFVQKAFDVQIICLSWEQDALGGEQNSNDSEVFNESNSAARHKWTEPQIKLLIKEVEQRLCIQVRYASAVAFGGGDN